VLDPGAPSLSSGISAWGWAFVVGDEKGFALFPTKDLKISPIEAGIGQAFAAAHGNAALAKLFIDKAWTGNGLPFGFFVDFSGRLRR